MRWFGGICPGDDQVVAGKNHPGKPSGTHAHGLRYINRRGALPACRKLPNLKARRRAATAFDPTHYSLARREAHDVEMAGSIAAVYSNLLTECLPAIRRCHQINGRLVARSGKPRNGDVLSVGRNRRTVDRTAIDFPAVFAEIFGRRPASV